MNDCEHRTIRIEAAWAGDLAGHLICFDCGQTHPLTRDESERAGRLKKLLPDAGAWYLAFLLKEEDRLEADPDEVHT